MLVYMQNALVSADFLEPFDGVASVAWFSAKITQFAVKVAHFSAAAASNIALSSASGAVKVAPFLDAISPFSTKVAFFRPGSVVWFATVSIFSGPQLLPPHSTVFVRSKGSPVRSNWTLFEEVFALFRLKLSTGEFSDFAACFRNQGDVGSQFKKYPTMHFLIKNIIPMIRFFFHYVFHGDGGCRHGHVDVVVK